MKFNLEFNMEEPEDKAQYRVYMLAMDWALAVSDLDEKLRSWLKHGHPFTSPDQALEATRQTLHDILQERGISLDDIR